jgi:hypothetical protein
LNVHPLVGFTTATQAAIQAAVVTYLNALGIGQTAVWSEMFGAAVSVNPNPNTPLFSVRSLYLGTSASPAATSDIPIAFNFASSGSTVVVNLV